MSKVKIRGKEYEVNVLDIFLYLGSIDQDNDPQFFRQPENVKTLGKVLKTAIADLPDDLISVDGKLNLLAEELVQLIEDARYNYFIDSCAQAKEAGNYRQEFISAKQLAKIQAQSEKQQKLKDAEVYNWNDEEELVEVDNTPPTSARVFYFFQQYYKTEIAASDPDRAVKLNNILDQATQSFLSNQETIGTTDTEKLRLELESVKAKLNAQAGTHS